MVGGIKLSGRHVEHQLIFGPLWWWAPCMHEQHVPVCLQALIDRRECHCTLIALTALLFAGSLGGTIWLFLTFAPEPSCKRNIAFITMTLALGMIVTLLSLAPRTLQSAGLMTSMLVVAYGVYLCAAALMTAPTHAACSKVVDISNHAWITVRCCATSC
jgi:Serine incorporator (Serinc)